MRQPDTVLVGRQSVSLRRPARLPLLFQPPTSKCGAQRIRAYLVAQLGGYVQTGPDEQHGRWGSVMMSRTSM